MISGLVLGEGVPQEERSSSPSNPSQAIGKVDKPVDAKGKGQKDGHGEGGEAVDRKQEMRNALMDFVIRVARNEGGKNTEAEVAALPQIAALVYWQGKGAEKWPR